MRSHVKILRNCSCGLKPRGQTMGAHYADVAAAQGIQGPWKVVHGIVDAWPTPGNAVLCSCCPQVVTFAQYEVWAGRPPVQGRPLRQWVTT